VVTGFPSGGEGQTVVELEMAGRLASGLEHCAWLAFLCRYFHIRRAEGPWITAVGLHFI